MNNGARLAERQCVNWRGISGLALPALWTGSHVSYARGRSVWYHLQRQYWDEVADKYDRLYEGLWSRMENAWVTLRLSFIADLVRPTVVDLGCGTGLGRRIVDQVNPYTEYLGVDISPSMARIAAVNGASVTIGSMDDLGFLADASTDVVLALFASVSFAFEPARAISEVSRVLRPSGYAYLSVLSRRALSRLGRCVTGNGWYLTRGDSRRGSGTAAHFFDIDDMRHIGRSVGLTILSSEGVNTLSGVCEIPCLWPVGRLMARILPQSSHLIDVLFQKVG